jgi:acyl-CoA thioesterase-1
LKKNLGMRNLQPLAGIVAPSLGNAMRTPLRHAIAATLILLSLSLPALAEPIHIVALGDSATSGWLVPRGEAYPAQLQRMLRAKGYDVAVKNAGVPGDTSAAALKRLDLAVDPDTDIVIVELGTNDLRAHVPRAKMEASIGEIVRTLQKRRIAVLLIGLGSLDLSELARRLDVPYAEWRLPPHRYRARDGAHFDAEGYRILLTRTLPQIETLIRGRQRPKNGM